MHNKKIERKVYTLIQHKIYQIEQKNQKQETRDKKEKRFLAFLKKRWKYFLGIFVTIGLMSFLIFKNSPSELIECFSSINSHFLLLSLLCFTGLFIVKTIRWQYILRVQGYKISFFETLKLILIGTFGSSITPAKVGDVLRAFYLSKNKQEIQVGESVFSVVFDRILDLGGIFLILMFGLPYIVFSLGLIALDWWMIVGFCVGVLIFIILAVFSLNKKVSQPLIHFVLRFISKIFKKSEVKEKINISSERIIEDFYTHQKKFKILHYFILALLSVLFWFLLGLEGLILLKAFNASIVFPIAEITVTLCFSAIAAMAIPISISGIGIRDAIMVFLLNGFLGISQNITLSLSIFQTFLNVLLPGLIGGIIILVINNKFINKKEQERTIS